MLAFYTQNKNQILRLFRLSALGQRKKAQRDKYITDMIDKSFDKQPPRIDLSALKGNLEALPVSETAKVLEKTTPDIYMPPHGLVREIAAAIYNFAPRPVPEIAVAASIGLLSGICGRCYNISGTGLNQYTLLLAKTGRGKEAMNGGISKLLGSISHVVKDASMFYGPSKIASQQALLKHIANKSKSFVSIMGEFPDVLKKMLNESRNTNQQDVKSEMLNLYNKSGKGDVLGEMIYSDKDKNTKAVTAPAFSILGEGTPEKYYELLTEATILEGFASRFNVIEYLGPRPPLNENHQKALVPDRLQEQLGQLCAYSLQLNSSNNVINIDCDADAKEYLDKFNVMCDRYINDENSNISGASAELWNRGHIKALKLSGLLAVGTNYINPKVSLEQAKWAVRLIKSNINNLLNRFDNGDVGCPQVQNKQLDDLKKAFTWYLRKPWDDVKKYPGATEVTYKAKIVPHSFITSICRTRASFKQDKLGPVQALKTLLNSLIESGEIQEVNSLDKMKLGISRNGKSYVILDVKSFL
jgi:hypothetical protein